EYGEKKRSGGEENQAGAGEAKDGKRDLEMEALVPVVRGEVRAVFVTSDEVTLRNAIRIIQEYKLKGIVQASAAVHKFADQLAAERIPVLWAGTMTDPGPEEPFDLYYRAAALLAEKGVLFAFDVGGSHNVRNLPMPAALSVANGLPEEEAIKALTINPAKILGVDSMVGSLEVGKTANVVVWSGSPIQMRSRVQQVIIDGKQIPLTSYQTRLRDRFEKIVRERMKRR
ncbi:MAG: amidohydrolase family protein, partial [Acidobacteriota bacterium]